MEVLKQTLGVDVSKDTLDVCLGRLNNDFTTDFYECKVFNNTLSGFKSLNKWVKSNIDESIPVRVIMEATGVYHKKFAYFMNDLGYQISIILPNKMSHFMKTLDVKTITDKTASKAIARFGLERTLKNWNKPSDTYAKLQKLTRERDRLVDLRTAIKNMIHAEKSDVFINKSTIQRLEEQIRFFNKQEDKIKNEIQEMLAKDTQVSSEVQLITTIPGVGWLTAVIILAETNGFEYIHNKKQLTSYAGLDIIEKQSGTSVHGKPRLSKKGNRHIRKALHFPSLTAVKHSPIHREYYTRTVQNHGIKMKSLVAVQRKILELSYVLWKNKTVYDPNYENKKRADINQTLSEAGS